MLELEFNFRYSALLLHLHFKKFCLLETKCFCYKICRKRLHFCVKCHHGVIVKSSRCHDFILAVANFALQLHEICGCLKVWIVFRNGKTIVIDYKTGQTEPEKNINQVKGYMKLMKEMGYTDVEGWLLYTDLLKAERIVYD